ncbi:MAG TPA: 50S ribosomal protein L25/general stress protein Ctc [Gammaproteobacteria bacterium]|nr:50S ribosomal protein L25/general stress protein Ctc [Gammaproteobacteria bacterium]
MSTQYELNVQTRDEKGTAAGRRIRHQGRLPAVVYGGKSGNAQISVDQLEILLKLEDSSFRSSVISLRNGKKREKVIIRDIQMQPQKHRVLHMDFQRIKAGEAIHLPVSLHLTGEEQSPGLLEGGLLSHLITEVEISCLPDDLPDQLTIDISKLETGDVLHLSDIELPETVELTALNSDGEDLAVVTIMAPKAAVEESADEEEEEAGSDVVLED